MVVTGKGRRAIRQPVAEKEPLFADRRLHNGGICWRRVASLPAHTRVELAPGALTGIEHRELPSLSEPPRTVVGRFGITLDPKDRGACKTPSHRNIALTAQGSTGSAADVIFADW